MKLIWIALALTFAAQAQQRVEVTLELREGNRWKSVDPGHVFSEGDRVRFRFSSTFGGYLYVVNQESNGASTTLYPTEETGTDNRIEPGRDYVIPSTEGAFRITGPAGYDVVSWIVSPARLGGGSAPAPKYKPLPPPPAPAAVPAGLKPRCDDSILRARGECVDTAAGLQQNAPAGLRAREVFFLRKEEKSVVSAPPPAEGAPSAKGLFSYAFRLAHR